MGAAKRLACVDCVSMASATQREAEKVCRSATLAPAAMAVAKQ